jgi:cobaltochelatase CobS
LVMTDKMKKISCKKLFGVDMADVPAFADKSEYVPDIDENYNFQADVTRALLAGFKHNKRVLLHGYHGTGKSTHIEQVAARLNWPCVRINLDSNITRMDLIGRDAIILRDGKQVTEFKEGLLPWALQHGVALVFDEYDAGRPDVMFVLQRILEDKGKLTLLEQGRVITPHPDFRLFATANTIGQGDMAGIYHGTQPLNQGQLDRWHIVVRMDYINPKNEEKIIAAKVKSVDKIVVKQMVALANLVRAAFKDGDLSVTISPRTVIIWAENIEIFGDIKQAFKLTFLNKCDEMEYPLINELYQRCFDDEIL